MQTEHTSLYHCPIPCFTAVNTVLSCVCMLLQAINGAFLELIDIKDHGQVCLLLSRLAVHFYNLVGLPLHTTIQLVN